MSRAITTGSAALLSIASLTSSPAVLANPMICGYDGETRKIEVVYAEPGQAVPCEVIYSNSEHGTMESLWQASHEAGYCEAQADALAEKLKKLGWHCSATETE